MRAIWFFAMAFLLMAPRSVAQPEAAIIELEAYAFHGDLKYYQTIDAGGRLTVRLAKEESGYDVASTGDEATVPPALFQALKELLVNMERSGGTEGWRRDTSALVVIRDFEGEVLETVDLDFLPPGHRRLILDLFSILHTYASDVELDLVGVGADGERLYGRRDDTWSLIRWHIYVIEVGVFLLVIGLAKAVIGRRKR